MEVAATYESVEEHGDPLWWVFLVTGSLWAIFAFFLLLRGTWDIVVALLVRPAELWWAGLVSGLVQVLLAFWAAGDFGHKAFLLVVWVGASALAHGIVQILIAFRLRPHGATAT